MTSLLGRDVELARTERWLEAGARLVSVTGPAGIGKTRLVREIVARRPGGAVVCDLAECRSMRDVERALERGLGVTRARLDVALRGSRGLVVLDRCDALVTPLRERIRSWSSEPGPALLVTSRESLEIPEEHRLVLGALAEEDALALYGTRARRPVDVPTARAIVARLERNPLAVELAGARAAVVSDRDLLARLERGALAIDAARGGLRAAIAWSVGLLEPVERDVLFQCAVFQGPFDARAAEAVVRLDPGEAVSVIEALVALERKSLVRAVVEERGEARAALYDAVREVAREELARVGGKLGAEGRHAQHFLGCAVAALAVGFDRPSQLRGTAADLAAARSVVAETDPAASVRLALALDLVHGTQEPPGAQLELLESAVACAVRTGSAELLAEALHARARAHRLAGSVRRAKADLCRALAAAREVGAPRLEGRVLRLLGVVSRQSGHPQRARVLLARARALFEIEVASRELGMVLDDLGVVAHDLGDLVVAREHYEQALAIERVVGDRRFEGITRGHLGLVAHELGDAEGARLAYREALEIHRATEDGRFEIFALAFLAALALEQGELETAAAVLREAAPVEARMGDVDSAVLLAGLECAVHAARGDVVRAREALAHARAETGKRDAEPLDRMLQVFGGAVLVAEGRRARAEGRQHDAAASRERVRRLVAPEEAPSSVEEKVARRVVEHLLASDEPTRSAVLVAADGAWFEGRAGRVPLTRRRSLALVLARLARSRAEEVGVPVGIDALFRAGWPGEVVRAASARRRVYVAVDSLRALGLRGAIVQREGGYFLDPAVEIRDPGAAARAL